MLYADTIAAIATPPGEGGIGIIRLSGPAALQIVGQIWRSRRAGGGLRPQHMRLGHVRDEAGQIVDEALAVWFKAPRSFTGEEVVELHCHGGALPLQAVLAVALRAGARAAEPGEFTMRAFANGRLDLAQAEALLDVIQARTQAGLRLALDQLGGWLSRELAAIRELTLGPLAYVTALTDFPEDEVPLGDLRPDLEQALARLDALLDGAAQGMVVRQGARAVLVGQPNAGKSSLLNVLLRRERAIVTPIPGTTRDTIEELAQLGGVPIFLVDTAGVAETVDPVERMGVERSRAAIARADLALLLVDQSRPLDPRDLALAGLLASVPTVLVLTKADLPGRLDAAPLRGQLADRLAGTVRTSATSGAGVAELADLIARVVLGGLPLSDARLVTNPRHVTALRQARAGLAEALAGLATRSPDLLAIELDDVLRTLGEITGQDVHDDLLSAIFSRFCIGK